MASYLYEWLSSNGYPTPSTAFISVQRDVDGIVLFVPTLVAEDLVWHDALCHELTTQWGLQVRIEQYPWSHSPVERIREILELGGATFLALMPDSSIEIDPTGGVFCRFSSRVAYELFQKWGGACE